MRLAILGSTRGSNMQALIDAINKKNLSAEIAIVVSNKADAHILKLAKENKIETKFFDAKGLSRVEYDNVVSDFLHERKIDLIVLIGYMRILSSEFVNEWKNKIINVHPSLLPDFAGLMDMSVHEAVLAAGKKETGCTVHYVTEEVDAGPIILQKKCNAYAEDSPLTLKGRVQALEREALVEAILHLSSRAPQQVRGLG